MPELSGVLVPLASPMHGSSGELDHAGLRALVEHVVEAGVGGIVVGGSTGEFQCMDMAERMELTEHAIAAASGRVPVVVHVGASATRWAVALAEHATAAGAAAVMAVQPFYEPLTEAEIIHYFAAVAEAAGSDVVAYNVPSCSGRNLEPQLLARLARDVKRVRYVKDSTGDLAQIMQVLNLPGSPITPLNGHDCLTAAAFQVGVPGAILGSANVLAAEFVALHRHLRDGAHAEAHELWTRVWPVALFLVTHGYIQSVKAGMELAGLSAGDPRGPFRPLEDDERAVLGQLITAARAVVSAR